MATLTKPSRELARCQRMKQYFAIAFLLASYIVFLAVAWYVSESGSHTSLAGDLRSEWRGWYLFGEFEYLTAFDDYEIDEYSGPEGLYVVANSYFTYHNEPHILYLKLFKNK